MGDSLVPGVSSGDVEKVRAAVLALEAEGVKPSVRVVRGRAGVANDTAMEVLRALRDGRIPPAAAGPWTTVPWAVAQDRKRLAEEARDLRKALHAVLELVHDDQLAVAAGALYEVGVDLRRVAAAHGIDDLEIPAGPIVTVRVWLAQLEAQRSAPPA